MPKPKSNQRPRGNGQRPLKVGEEIRHILADVLTRGGFKDPTLDNTSITISEVRVSPDLKNATVYAMPLGGLKLAEVMDALNQNAPMLRHLVTQRMALRYSPRLHFRSDNTYEEASHIDSLLRKPDVRRDLQKMEEEE